MGRKYVIGIQANVDAGKTTLTEQLLYLQKSIRKKGSVDEGTTASDFLPVERRRGISVRTSLLEFQYGGDLVRILDTPGHLDFSGEVLRSLYALDGVILMVSGSDGAEGRTRSICEALRSLRMPFIICVNKIDLPGFSRDLALRDLSEKLGGIFVPRDLPPKEMLPYLAEGDPELEEKYLLDEPVSNGEILGKLREMTMECRISPVVFTSAKNGEGVELLLETLLSCLPDTKRSDPGALSGTVFAVSHDPRDGKAAWVRLFGGEIRARDVLPLKRLPSESYEKVSQIRRIQGNRETPVELAEAGDIAVFYGLSDIRTGDVIGAAPAGRKPVPEGILDAKPLLLSEVLPEPGTDEIKAAEALRILTEEEPLLAFERNALTGRMFVHILGEIQTEILTELLRERFGLSLRFSAPRVIFREKPVQAGYGEEAYLMPKPCWAIVKLRVEPLPPGSGIQFETVIKEKELPYRYQEHVRESIEKTVQQGLYGWEVMDCRFTLVGGMSHHVHTHPLDFFVATPIAVLRALKDAGERLYEPWMRLSLKAPETLFGRVSGQILRMNGSFSAPVMADGSFMMEAEAPLRLCASYPVEFRSLTSGEGQISMRLLDYREAPPDLDERFPRRGVDPLDRAKWILACRSALGADLTGRQ